MTQLSLADWTTLGVYLLGITVLGVWSSRQVQAMSDFVMPRRFGKLMMLMHGFGTSTHSDQAVTVASKCYSTGLSGIWYQWMWLFATPFFWLIAPMMRRFRALTVADVFAARYGPSVAVLFCVFGLAKFVVTIGNMLKGSGTVIEACTGVPANISVLIVTVLFVVYGLAGGLRAAIVTDFIQGILTILFSFLLLPVVLNAVGGIAGMKTTFAQIAPDRQLLTLVIPGGIGPFYIGMIALNALLSVPVQPHNMGTCAAGRTELDGAIGFMGGTFLKRFCTVAWCLTGLAAFAYYQGSIDTPDEVYGIMAAEFLPTILPGLLGLFLAGLLATVMGSCDSFMISASGLISENLYRPLFPRKTESHYLRVARIGGLLVVTVSLAYTFWLSDVVKGLEILWKLNAVMAPAFWLGVFWRRTTTAGAWVATLATAFVWWITGLELTANYLQNVSLIAQLDVVRSGNISIPWQMVFYLTAGFVSGIIVSLFTTRPDAEQLECFYEVMRTPVQPDEEIVTPCRLPANVTAAPRRVFFPNTELEIPLPTWKAASGFVVGWLLVAGIIGGVWSLITF